MKERIKKIKEHIEKHKDAYAIGTTIGIIGAAIGTILYTKHLEKKPKEEGFKLYELPYEVISEDDPEYWSEDDYSDDTNTMAWNMAYSGAI